ncbi:MAG: hypothetical protein M3Y87_32040, partial [Myxococcota bacterium]|nr:hypothetical protein [Myxococcota bacterium]
VDGAVLPDGAPPPVDAGGRDGGPPPTCDRALLACAPSCDELFDSVFAEATFDVDQGDFTFRPVRGSGALEDGHLVTATTDTWFLTLESWGFGTVAACAEIEVELEAIDASTGVLFGLRGGEHGSLLRLRPERQRAQLAAFVPDLVTLDERALAIPTGAATTARYVVLSFVTADYAHGEARRVETGEIAALHGPYDGASGPLELEISLITTTGRVRVDWVKVGRLTAGARATLDALP